MTHPARRDADEVIPAHTWIKEAVDNLNATDAATLYAAAMEISMERAEERP